MAIESSVDASEAWATIRRNAAQIKTLIAAMNSTLSAGNVSLEVVFNQVYRPILNSMNQLNALALGFVLGAVVL